MKPRSIPWPDLCLLLAAAGGVTFFLLQQRSAANLEAENSKLSQRIVAWEKRRDSTDDETKSGPIAKAFEKSGPSGMAKFAALLRGARSGNPVQVRDLLLLDNHLRSLDVATLEAMIADARAADLSGEDREAVIDKLLEALVEKDPARAFAVIEEGFAGKSPREIQQEFSKRTGYFGNWLKHDGPQALAWLDRQIAAGLFDSRSLAGTSDVRQGYESLIYRITKDGSRIAALDPLDRLPTLLSWRLRDLPVEEQIALAKVARTSGLKPSEVVDVMKPFLQKSMQSGDLASADAFFEQIDPTPEELPQLSEAAAGQAMVSLGKKADQLTGDEVPAIRSWLADKSSEGDAYIGSMIGKGFSNGWDAGQIYATMERLQKDQPSDDLLYRFLLDATQEGHKQKLDPATALDFANRITDPGKRADVMNSIKAQ
jgi:hypothetical protein